MNEQKFRDVHAHMTDLQRIADDLRVARAVRRSKAEAADRPAPPGPSISQARQSGSDRRAACPEDLGHTRPA